MDYFERLRDGTCLICGCKVITNGVCVGCGAGEGQIPIERKLTDKDRRTAKSLTQHTGERQGPRESGEGADRQFHGGLGSRGEW